MFDDLQIIYLIVLCSFFLTISSLNFLNRVINRKRVETVERLRRVGLSKTGQQEDPLKRPFVERVAGPLARLLVTNISQITPQKARKIIEDKLQKAGNPGEFKSSDFLAIQGIVGTVTLVISWFLLNNMGLPLVRLMIVILTIVALIIYLPWFVLEVLATQRRKNVLNSLPDIIDLLVVSVQAGLAFEAALFIVIEKFPGIAAYEFQQALKEIQLGKARKQALRDMADRIDLPELCGFVNAIIQSEQLGVGLSNVLRLQSDLIRERRQYLIEEKAMKAPVKILFPLVFFIFPCIFMIILGPAVINILKTFGRI